MSTYTAPIHDMLFTMREVGGLDAICSSPRHDELTPDLVEAILGEAARYAGEVLDPLNRVGDRQGVTWRDGNVLAADGFRQAYVSFCQNGWNAMPASAEWGGQGLPTLVSTAVLEMWKSANLAFSLCQMLTLGAVAAIEEHGSDELKRRFLGPMVAGKWTGTMNLTEPQAGSDLAAISSRAVPEADHYRVRGQKIFITWGEHDLSENIIHLVLARLPGAPAGVKGISLFVCPKYLVNPDGSIGPHNDLACTSVEHKLGIHGCPTASMSFGEREGAVGYLVGEPHQGLSCMFTMMNHARLNVGLEGVGISERAYQHARGYARDRVQGKPILTGSGTIAGHPDVRRMLMDMKSRIQAMRALAYFCAGQMDRAGTHPDVTERSASASLVELLTPVVKGWCTDNAIAITSDGVQIHGGMGYIEETGAAQYLRDARITTIYEGTTGIQANDLIGRKVSRDGGRTAKGLIARMEVDARRLLDSGNRAVAVLGRTLQSAVHQLDASIDWILVEGATRPELATASAVPFLRLTGTVVSGWLSARIAEAAAVQLQGRMGDHSFLTGKIATSSHYSAHFLVQARVLSEIVISGAESTLAISDEQL